jgi:hypothetical protein
MKKRIFLLDLLIILILVSIALFIWSYSGSSVYTGFSFKLILSFIAPLLMIIFSLTFTIIILVDQYQRNKMNWFVSTLIALILAGLGIIIAIWYYFSILIKALKKEDGPQNL